ncbi:MAG TPA: hypothetical protein VIJ25_02335, partial [Methylococcales bacterium]
VKWVEKPRASYRCFKGRDQNGSGECVVMTYATELSIVFFQKYGVWVDFSSSFPYQQRKYPENSGCSSEDVYTIFPRIGNVFESFMPSQQMSDAQAMAVPRLPYFADLALPFSIKRIQLPIDFDVVASTSQATGKGIMVWFKFSMAEWTNIPEIHPVPTTSGHSVTVVDVVLKNGVQYLVIQDSWGLQYADQGLRLISREYFNARCFLASYLLSFKTQDNTTVARPHFDGSIVSAQKCFKWEGLFPANIDEVESWGNITKSACKAFQIRFGITPAEGNFGPITKAKLQVLYP